MAKAGHSWWLLLRNWRVERPMPTEQGSEVGNRRCVGMERRSIDEAVDRLGAGLTRVG